MSTTKTAPMTAGEAASKLYADRAVWLNDGTPPESFSGWLRDWFTRHWPAGGAVTGRTMHDALFAETGPEWDVRDEGEQHRWNRAAARLSAQMVAFDVEAVAREIAEKVPAWYYGPDSGMTYTDTVTAILRRHAAARLSAQATTNSGAASSSVGVCVTADDVNGMSGVHSHDQSVSTAQARADWLNRRLSARAGTAGQTTGAQWVRRPEGQASTLVVPEDGWYVRCFDGEWQMDANYYSAGPLASSRISAVRQYDDLDGSTGPLIERTPATAGGWTLDNIPEAGKPFWCEDEKGVGCGYIRQIRKDGSESYGLPFFNAYVTRWHYILPPVEAQP